MNKKSFSEVIKTRVVTALKPKMNKFLNTYVKNIL